MNWVSKKIHLYNVTMGLYMLDWWEQLLFNVMMLVLLWFVCFNAHRLATESYDGYTKLKFLGGEFFAVGGSSSNPN